MRKNLKIHIMLKRIFYIILGLTLSCLSVLILLYIFDIYHLSPINISLLFIITIFVLILFGEIVLKKNHDKED